MKNVFSVLNINYLPYFLILADMLIATKRWVNVLDNYSFLSILDLLFHKSFWKDVSGTVKVSVAFPKILNTNIFDFKWSNYNIRIYFTAITIPLDKTCWTKKSLLKKVFNLRQLVFGISCKVHCWCLTDGKACSPKIPNKIYRPCPGITTILQTLEVRECFDN